MYKKAWCTCKVVVLLIKPIVFLTFSLPSASLDVKVPNVPFIWKVRVLFKTRRECLNVFISFPLNGFQKLITINTKYIKIKNLEF